MADYPPYMNAYGNVPKILRKIKTAQEPEKFTQDFLATVLGFSGGSAKPFIPLAKRAGLLHSDGTPTELYRRFRNPATSRQAVAEAIKTAYHELFTRNEYAHKLPEDELRGLIVEVTGLPDDDQKVLRIARTFEGMKELADFESKTTVQPESNGQQQVSDAIKLESPSSPEGLNFSYSIYLNLPNTTDIAVFNAIFKSLRENLLR